MTRLAVLLVSLATVSFGCAHRRVPARADIELVSVTVATHKADGSAWDDVEFATRLLDAAAPKAVQLATSSPLSAEAIAIVAEALRESFAKAALPDPSGAATLVSDEGQQTVPLPKHANTYVPAFRVTWRDVPLSPSTRIRIDLIDADVWGSESIGSVELTYADLARAARGKGTSEIAVDDRAREVRSVGVIVRGAAGKGR